MILRLFTTADTSLADELHGFTEVPGGTPIPFTSTGQLVAALTRLAHVDATQAHEDHTDGAALCPPGATAQQ